MAPPARVASHKMWPKTLPFCAQICVCDTPKLLVGSVGSLWSSPKSQGKERARDGKWRDRNGEKLLLHWF